VKKIILFLIFAPYLCAANYYKERGLLKNRLFITIEKPGAFARAGFFYAPAAG
jgi:hypothetical protein